jgi:hypothetical protein
LRAIALLVVAAVLVTGLPARALADEGDAPDVEAPRAPGVEARVAVIVLGQDGEPLPAATRATLQVTMERALQGDERLEIVDQDTELAKHAGQVPLEAISEARGLARAGEELLRRGQSEPARIKLEQASRHLAEVLAWTSKQELAQAQFLLGAALAVDGEKKDALAAFVSLLAWRPEFVADPEIWPEKVLPLWEKAQEKAAKLDGGSIEISSSPEGAMAYVDGRFVGFTPTIVEGLPAATHYVTVRMYGRVRSVAAVKVSDRRPSELKVSLDPTPGVDRLREAIDAIAGGVGAAQANAEIQAAFGDLSELLMVDHAAVLVAPDGAGPYRGYVYAVEGGTLLAKAELELGERDPEDAFGELAAALYQQISFEPKEAPPPKKPRRTGAKKPFYTRWWFWSAVGAVVVTSIAVPLLLRDDGAPELGCPPGDSCGTVIFRF